jgi:hypothetical protein
MFDTRPSEAKVTTSRVFDTSRAAVDVGTRSTRMINYGIRAIMCYVQAVIWGFGALATSVTAGSLGRMLFVLALGCLISGGFVYAGNRLMSRARTG